MKKYSLLKKVIKLWNFGNFGIPKIIPKSLVTLRFSKIWLQELKGICKCIQKRYWPNFYVDPAYSNTYLFKLGRWRVFLQATVHKTGFVKTEVLTSVHKISSWNHATITVNEFLLNRPLCQIDIDKSRNPNGFSKIQIHIPVPRASYKNESCKENGWFNIFPNFTWFDRKITVFAMLQK